MVDMNILTMMISVEKGHTTTTWVLPQNAPSLLTMWALVVVQVLPDYCQSPVGQRLSVRGRTNYSA